MTTDTPTTPEACRAEQERWQKPLEKYETLLAEYEREDEAYWLQDDVLSKPYPRRLEAKRRRLERLREELNDFLTPTLARQYADLLAAHAEALARAQAAEAERDRLLAGLEKLTAGWSELTGVGVCYAAEEVREVVRQAVGAKEASHE